MIYKNACIDGKTVDIEVTDGKITCIEKINKDGFDLENKKVFAGLADIHSHGCMGFDTMDGNHLDEMSAFMAKNGVTSWLPTTMTMDMDTIKSVVNAKIPNSKGAGILGYHLEGPYISAKYKGAQNEKYIIPPDISEFEKLDNIKMVTVAPELENAFDFIEKCKAVVSIGHTDCNYECAKKAIKLGAKCLTHTFNAMPPIHHRNPGPIGAAFDENIFVQVICDGIHIHPSVIRLLYKLFGAKRMILISDSMRATGLSDGEYEFGGQRICVKNSVARTQDGAIAGSTSTLLNCVKKAMEFGIPERDAFKMASQTPCKLLGIKKGKIEVGYDADFIALDNNYNVIHTVIGGELI